MLILGIVGSPRKRERTNALVGAILDSKAPQRPAQRQTPYTWSTTPFVPTAQPESALPAPESWRTYATKPMRWRSAPRSTGAISTG